MQQNVVIPPKSEAILPARVVCNDLSTPNIPGQSWTTQSCALESGVQVSRAVMPENDVDLPVRVLNVQQTEVQLEAGQVLSDLEPSVSRMTLTRLKSRKFTVTFVTKSSAGLIRLFLKKTDGSCMIS